jgi:hypothetical protein
MPWPYDGQKMCQKKGDRKTGERYQNTLES